MESLLDIELALKDNRKRPEPLTITIQGITIQGRDADMRYFTRALRHCALHETSIF